MSNFLKIENHGRLVVLTMDQPEQRNPLTGNTAVPEFLAAIDAIHNDPQVRCVILTGNGPSFSAGGDIKTMKTQSGNTVSEMQIRHDYRTGIQRLVLALFNLEIPVIAAINGHAIGAGLDLACMCDIRIASENAKFAESFVKLGIIPGDGGAWLLPRTIGYQRASEMTFTGDMIDAQKALAWNLVSDVVALDQLMPTAMALAERITKNPSHSVRLAKRLMRESMHLRLDSSLEMAAAYQAISHKTPDHREAVDAFLEKRSPSFS